MAVNNAFISFMLNQIFLSGLAAFGRLASETKKPV